MNFDGNFRSRGRVDIAGLCARVTAEPDTRWRDDPFRQRAFEVHEDTETIFLIYDRDMRHLNPTPLPAYDSYASLVAPVLAQLAAQLCPDGWCVRCLLTRLRPGGHIRAHVDQGFSLRRSHRVHLPIVASGDVTFSVGGETRQLAPGELWEINNMRLHAVENTGVTPRIHLIVDWACPALVMADV
jgi:hypothetical protein